MHVEFEPRHMDSKTLISPQMSLGDDSPYLSEKRSVCLLSYKERLLTIDFKKIYFLTQYNKYNRSTPFFYLSQLVYMYVKNI